SAASRILCLLRKKTPICAESHIVKKERTRIVIGYLIKSFISGDFESSAGHFSAYCGEQPNGTYRAIMLTEVRIRCCKQDFSPPELLSPLKFSEPPHR